MFHYESCGLDNIYLINGYAMHETEYGQAVSIENLDSLHQAIVSELVNAPRRLTGSEVRFLRKELDMSQKSLGGLMDKTDQMVAHWEKENYSMPQSDELILRMLASESILHQNKNINFLIRLLKDHDEAEIAQDRKFKESERGWEACIDAA